MHVNNPKTASSLSLSFSVTYSFLMIVNTGLLQESMGAMNYLEGTRNSENKSVSITFIDN